jgi:hypothetical protein
MQSASARVTIAMALPANTPSGQRFYSASWCDFIFVSSREEVFQQARLITPTNTGSVQKGTIPAPSDPDRTPSLKLGELKSSPCRRKSRFLINHGWREPVHDRYI